MFSIFDSLSKRVKVFLICFLSVLTLLLGYSCYSTYRAIGAYESLVEEKNNLENELLNTPPEQMSEYHKNLIRRLVKQRDQLIEYKNNPKQQKPAINIGSGNGNPGNVKKPDVGHWKGTLGYDSRNFAIFEHHVFGIRAIAITLLAYEHKHGIKTVEKLIERYSKTDRKAYTNYVCKRLGVKPNQKISFTKHLPELVDAICTFEISHSGKKEMGISRLDIRRGCQMAINDSKYTKK